MDWGKMRSRGDDVERVFRELRRDKGESGLIDERLEDRGRSCERARLEYANAGHDLDQPYYSTTSRFSSYAMVETWTLTCGRKLTHGSGSSGLFCVNL